jgi:hypothetical protein
MLMALALAVLLAALLSAAERERREARLRAGAPAWGDLARITGLSDQRELVRLPGVSLAGDGRPLFDPARRSALPVHLTGCVVDHPIGHGLSLALALAMLGLGLEHGGGELPLLAPLLLAAAAGYQLLARLYALVVWVEVRTVG